MEHWHEVFDKAHLTYEVVRAPGEVVKDPQLAQNDIVVPIEDARGKLTTTISSPIQIHGVTKVAARRAPAIGEHGEQVLTELGFSAAEIDGLQSSGTAPHAEISSPEK